VASEEEGFNALKLALISVSLSHCHSFSSIFFFILHCAQS